MFGKGRKDKYVGPGPGVRARDREQAANAERMNQKVTQEAMRAQKIEALANAAAMCPVFIEKMPEIREKLNDTLSAYVAYADGIVAMFGPRNCPVTVLHAIRQNLEISFVLVQSTATWLADMVPQLVEEGKQVAGEKEWEAALFMATEKLKPPTDLKIATGVDVEAADSEVKPVGEEGGEHGVQTETT